MPSTSEVQPDLAYTKGKSGAVFSDEYGDWIAGDDCDALEVNPFDPTDAKPGSENKVLMLAARYAAGLPLWHDSDCYDHGPGRPDLIDEE